MSDPTETAIAEGSEDAAMPTQLADVATRPPSPSLPGGTSWSCCTPHPTGTALPAVPGSPGTRSFAAPECQTAFMGDA